MGFDTDNIAGFTHDVHVRHENGDTELYEGVLDVMSIPNDAVKFTHNGDMTQISNGEIIRSRVNNVADAHKYVCPDCESDEGTLVTAGDYGDLMALNCSNCGHSGLRKEDL